MTLSMNWEKSENIDDILRENKSIVLVYSTNSLATSLPLNEILTNEELAYSEKLRGEGQKSTWLSCRATLRLILGSCLRRKPGEIEFGKGRFGKLHVPESNLFFNVSHSKTSFLLGFSFFGRIGVDIESLNDYNDLPQLAEYAFSDDEIQYCQNGDYPERFVEIWTCKEAFLKAVGVGLVDQLKSISVTDKQLNIVSHYGLKQHSFLCPNRETGSVVFQKGTSMKSIWFINF
jgi:4'-phosphopantetheinyl transferase